MATKRNHSQYTWNEGLDSGLQFGEETYSDRLVNFATSVLSNVNKAIERNTAGDIVHGMSLDKVNDFVTTSQELQSFLNNLDSNNKTYKGGKLGVNAVKDLWSISKKVGVDPSAFMSYFQDYVPKESVKSRNLRARINNDGLEQVTAAELGYNSSAQKYLADRKINLMRDADNNIYALNEDYSAFSPLQYLNRDLRLAGQEGSDYNHYLFTDNNGRVRYGKYSELAAEDPLQEAIQNYINTSNAKREGQYKLFNNFNPYLNYTDENKTVSDFIKRLGAAQNLQHSLNNFADVSQMFQGNKHVIAVKQDGTNFNEGDFIDGTLKLDPSYTFFFVGDDGSLQATNWSDPDIETKIGKYNPEGWSEQSNQVGITLKGLNLGESTITGDQIKDPVQWANRMLDLMTKPRTQLTSDDIKELEKYGSFGNYQNALSYIGSLISEAGLKLDQAHLNKWNALTQKYRTNDLVFNQNQVNLTDEEQDQKLIEEANQAGYSSVADYLGSQKKGFSTTEWMRLGALASDIASLGASFAPGAGTIASGILGAGASGTEFAADVMQDGFQWKDLSTLGINLGLDVVGLLPGGKSLKITKNAVKVISRSLPLLVGLWSAFADGDKYIAAANKLVHGNPQDMTAQDWQILGRGLMLITGGVRTGKATSGAYKSAGKEIKKGVQKGYKAVSDPIKHAKEVRDRAKRMNSLPKQAAVQGTTPKPAPKPTTNTVNPGVLDEVPTNKFGGKLDRFGEYLKSHK